MFEHFARSSRSSRCGAKYHVVYLLSFLLTYASLSYQMLTREILKNKPADLEDFVIALCEARLQGKPTPETAVGHNGGGDGIKPIKKTIIRIMRKDTSVGDLLLRKCSTDLSLHTLKKGSFTGTPLLDFGSSKKNSFSNTRFAIPPPDSLLRKRDSFSSSVSTPGDRDRSRLSGRESVISTASSEDSDKDT